MQSEKANIKDKNCTVKAYGHLKTQLGSYLLLKAGTSRVMDGELLLRSFLGTTWEPRDNFLLRF